MATISGLTEGEILSRMVPRLPRARSIVVPSGDDCAVLGLTESRVAVSTDMLVEGTHFRRDWSTGYDVGWRAAAQNLADSVAMGANPVSLVVSLELPGDLPVEWLDDFSLGLGDCARQAGAGVDGGDLTSGPHVTIGVTVLGDLEGREPRLRSAARPGESLVHAGVLGWSGAGLRVLTGDRVPTSKEAFAAETMVSAFRRPEPPLDVVLSAARAGELGALMDVSDGLLIDVGRIAAASHVWIDVDSAALERDVFQLELAGFSAEDARALVLTGGEDHGFVGTSPACPEDFRRIGEVRGEHQGGRVTVDGVTPVGAGGWEHFAR